MAAAIVVTPANNIGRRNFTMRSAFGKLTPSIPAFVSPLLRRRRCPSYCTTTTPAPSKASSTVAAAKQELETITSPRLVALEYADLNLADKFSEEVGHVRIRQHVNPLRSTLLVPAQVPDWNAVFEDATLPLMMDIGCDPHFKKKHHKRRVVQKPLVESIVDSLMPGGQVFIQSDVLEVAMDMRDHFDAESNKLIPIGNIDHNVQSDCDGWLLSNPMGIRTEREIHAEFEGARIYRRMYQKLI